MKHIKTSSKDRIYTKNINPNRFITKGYSRSSYLSLDGSLKLIPNDFKEYLMKSLISTESSDNTEFDELIKNEGFLVINPTNYQNIEYPNDVDTLIIEYSASTLKSIIRNLGQLIIGQIIIKISQPWDENVIMAIKRVGEEFKGTKLSLIFQNQISKQDILLKKLTKIESLANVYFTGFDQSISTPGKYDFDIFIKSNNEEYNCIIHLQPSKRLLIEAKYVNTLFNKRFIVDKQGNMKISENHSRNVTNVKSTNEQTLKNRMKDVEIQKYWKLTKNKIDVCSICEFRKACVDFRLPHQRAANEWYHKQECNYNPYIAKWNGEEGYRTLAECGVISNEKEFSIDHEKIAKINEELWND